MMNTVINNLITKIKEIIEDKENMTLSGYDVPAHILELALYYIKKCETSEKAALNISDVSVSLHAKKIRSYQKEAIKQAAIAQRGGHEASEMTSEAMAFAYKLCAELLEGNER